MVSKLSLSFEVLPNYDMKIIKFVTDHCQPNDETVIIHKICDFQINFWAGPSENMNLTLFSKIAKYFPAGASSKQFIHFAQMIISGKLQSFDHQENNIKKYGRITPPEYKLFKIKTPIAIFYGTTDHLVSVKDVENLARDLTNVVGLFKLEGYNHVDFQYANNIFKKINSKVIRIFRNFSGK